MSRRASSRGAIAAGALIAACGLPGGTARAGGNAPFGVQDQYETRMGRALTIKAPGVIANDNDPEGEPITVRLQQAPYGGTVTLGRRGGFIYTPNASFEGYDQFRYEPFDGDGYGAPVFVTIRVNGRPHARYDSYGLLAGDSQLIVPAPGVLENDVDSGGDLLAAELVVPTQHGDVELTSDGGFVYVPAPGYVGRDTFTYRARDDALASREMTVKLRIVTSNLAPVAGEDTFTVEEDFAFSAAAPGLLANDGDPDGDRVRVVVGEIPLEGLELRTDGSFDYTPPQDGDNDQFFTYRITDGITTSAPKTVRLDLQAINDPPGAEGEQYTVAQGGILTVPAPGVLANDADLVEFDGVHAVGPLAGPYHGRLILDSDGSFTYKPKPGYRGPDGFTYQAWDSQAGGVAGVEIEVQHVD